MGARYIITGVQLGMIKALIRTPDAISQIDRTLEHQFLFESDNSVYDDIRKIRNKLLMEEDDGK